MFFRQKKLIRNPHTKWDFWQKKYDKKKEFFVQLYSGIIFSTLIHLSSDQNKLLSVATQPIQFDFSKMLLRANG